MLQNEVIVYQSPTTIEHRKKSKISKRSLKKFLKFASSSFLIFALVGIALTITPLWANEIKYQIKNKKNRHSQPSSSATFSQLLKIKLANPVTNSPDPYFSLLIPKIGVQAKITANVNVNNQKSYQSALVQGVAHARGTVFPGMKGTIYLFAHSSIAPWQINHRHAPFLLLHKLEKGDKIIVFFQMKKFNYQVTEKKIISPSNTSFFKQLGKEMLVLQTCYPPGTAVKSLLIFAQRNPS